MIAGALEPPDMGAEMELGFSARANALLASESSLQPQLVMFYS